MILEPGKLSTVRARFSITFVILLALSACLGDADPSVGGPTSDTPSGTPEPGGRLDAGVRPSQDAAAGSFSDAGSHEESDAAEDTFDAASDAGSPTGTPCNPASDASPADGDVVEASIVPDAGDAQIDTDANFPGDAGDAQLLISDGSSDAPHMPATSDACVP